MAASASPCRERRDQIDGEDGGGCQQQSRPVGDDVARRRGAHAEQRLHPLDAGDLVGDEGGQRRAGAAAELPELGEDEPVDLGHHPGADGEIGALQAEHHECGRQREEARHQAGQQDRQQRIDAGMDGEGEQQVGAEPHERLLADGDEARVAGQQVPVLGQRQHGEHEDQVVDEIALGEGGKRQQRGKEQRTSERHAARGPPSPQSTR